MVDSLSIQNELEMGVIYEPDAVALTYNSPGWYVLFALIGCLVLLISILVVKHYLKNSYRRNAVRMLLKIESRFNKKADFECVNEAMVIVKHTAIHTYGRDEVAPLSGMEWLQFLDLKYKKQAFCPLENVVQTAMYQNKVSDTEQANRLFTTIKKWIHSHA